ncbi:MAG TPA: macrolide family glycosyltransferase [Blastocatellia bacterium]|jgi:MGT family glycosyltransferase|nr:macrolide family glycosyltransferase [Blastocatellia bacterium]
MSKALFFSLPLHGHINPSLPLVRELVTQGDEIVFYSSEHFAAKIEQRGAHYRPYRNAFLSDLTQVPERMDQLSWLLMRTTSEVLDNELDDFRAERPDYLITDSVAPWGQWVAEVLGVPVVTSVPTFAFNRRVLAFGFAHGVRPRSGRSLLAKMRHLSKALMLRKRLRHRYGVRGPGMMGLMFGHSNLNIVYTSRHFQPRVETFDDSFQFVGPSITPRTETIPFPWDQVRHPVIVYVSLGTLFNTDTSFYRNCFEAFRGEDLQVIMSVGNNVSPESLGPGAPNFIVQSYVPQLEVLARASAFVTHGGMNSVSESLSHGVPVVVIPQMGEQEIVGRRVEDLGAGLYLARAEVTAEKLRDSVRRLLAEDRFREQAALVRESFQRAGGVARAAQTIKSFTKSSNIIG